MATTDPMHQFEIVRIFPIEFLGFDISFTNSSLWIMLSIGVALWFMWPRANGSQNYIPSKMQVAQEQIFGMISAMVHDSVGSQAKKYFPIIFTLFLFVLSVNLMGMMPFSFTATSHIAVTIVLAFGVFLLVVGAGIAQSGLHYFAHFAPAGVPLVMQFLIVPIEIVSFLARPLTLAVRLCGNMAAGHIVLKIFASFIVMLGSAGFLSVLGILPFGMLLAINALEFFVAFLQAYIFATLTCIYLSESVQISH